MDDNIPLQESGLSLFLQLKSLVRQTSVYVTGNILTFGLGLILLPLYTAYLSPGDYGILGVANVMTTIAIIVLPFGLHGSVSKFYFDFKGDQRKRFFGSVWLFLITVPGALLLLLQFFGAELSDAFFVKIPFSPYLSLALWTGYVSIISVSLLQQILRVERKAVQTTIINIGAFLLTMSLTIWFVVGLKSGAEGPLWANLLGTGIVGCVSVVLLWKYIHFTLDMPTLKRGLAYGLPLLPHLLSFWIMMASDRIILGWYVPLSEVGIYTIGYQIASVAMMFLLAGNNGLIPVFGELNVSNQSEIRNLTRIVTYYIFSLTLIGLALSLYSPFIIKLLTPSPYHTATIVVPWLVLGFIFMALYLPCSNTVNYVVGDTRMVGLFTILAAALNIGLNIWLIPKIGMIGAAITTAASYLVLFVMVFYYAQFKQSLPWETRRIATILASGFVTFLSGRNFSSEMNWSNLILTTASLFIFPLILGISGFFNQQERGAVLQFFTRIRASAKLVL